LGTNCQHHFKSGRKTEERKKERKKGAIVKYTQQKEGKTGEKRGCFFRESKTVTGCYFSSSFQLVDIISSINSQKQFS
jgi:hypothetical protein